MKLNALIINIAAPLRKECVRLKETASIPPTIGPTVWPMSIIEPNMPMAAPWFPALLRSAICAALADVTMEIDTPRRIEEARRVRNENEKANINMHPPAMIVPQIICKGLP